jgi:archaellum biogenesis protein FlaJ (TadC family)
MDGKIAAHLERPPVAAAIGFASLAQAACFAVVIAVVGAALVEGGTAAPDHLALGVVWLVVLTLAGTLLCALAQAALIWHANETDALDDTERRRWLIRLTLWGPVVMPAYWRRYLRR